MKPKTKKILMLSGLALGGLTMFLLSRKQPSTPGATLIASTNPVPASSIATSVPAPTTTTQQQPAPPPRVSNWPEGTLLRIGSNDKVYVIDAMGYRHWISSRSYFDSSGYKMSDVKSITVNAMIAIPEGTTLGGLNGFGNPLFI